MKMQQNNSEWDLEGLAKATSVSWYMTDLSQVAITVAPNKEDHVVIDSTPR